MSFAEQVDKFRNFNRFHTRLVGALNDNMLASGYALPQLRVLYEIAVAPRGAPLSARDLSDILQIDPGYLSRLVSGLEADGLIQRTPTPENAKRLALTVTDFGRQKYLDLARMSASHTGALLEPLDKAERRELVGAMQTIERLLGQSKKDRTFILRDPEPGDMGWVVCAQARFYAKEYGWGQQFEALVSQIVAQFAENFDPAGEKCWIAEQDGRNVGSVFVVRQDEETAKLRLLYVDQAARGLGLGRRLVDECLRFARGRGYRRMELWTNDVLSAARHVYESAGFELINEERHHSFGKDLVGQNWGLDI